MASQMITDRSILGGQFGVYVAQFQGQRQGVNRQVVLQVIARGGKNRFSDFGFHLV